MPLCLRHDDKGQIWPYWAPGLQGCFQLWQSRLVKNQWYFLKKISATLSTCFSVIQFKDISMTLCRLRMGILSWKESPTPSSRSKVPSISSRVILVLYTLRSPLGFSSPWRNLEITWRYDSHLCPFCGCLCVFEVWKKHNNFFQIICNVFSTTSHIAPLAKVAHGDKLGTVERIHDHNLWYHCHPRDCR